MKLHQLSQKNHSSVTLAAFALILSALALFGNAVNIPVLTSLVNGQQKMVISTAIAILLAAITIIKQSLYPNASSKWLLRIIAFLLMSSGLLALFEFKLDPVWFDFNVLHQNNFTLHPGCMDFNAAICFIFLGVAIGSESYTNHKFVYYAGNICLIFLIIVSTFGVLSFIANFEFLSAFGRNNRMALPTALSFLSLSLALSLTQKLTKDYEYELSASKLYPTLELLLVIIVMIVALVSFASSQQRVEVLMATQLEKSGLQSRDYFETAFTLHHEAAILKADKTEFTEALLQYKHNQKLNLPDQLSGSDISKTGFSMLSLENPQHVDIYRNGQPTSPQRSIQIFSNPASYLLWDNGYFLRTSVPKYDDKGDLLGYVVTEQPIVELTRFHKNIISKPGTSDLVLCSFKDDYQICYPFRWSSKPNKYYGYLDGKPLPVTRAAWGETKTAIVLDYRRERVMAAIGPVGKTGLGMAIKIDMHELYEPIRKQFYASLPVFMLLIIFSLVLMRIKLKPLIDDIEQSRKNLIKLSLQDTLTGIANRTVFNDRLQVAISKLARSNKKIALIYLDIDFFKEINDSYGHAVGDQVLIWFSTKLRESVRQSDTVARIGGDEFSIIIEDINDSSDVVKIANLILEKLDEPLVILKNGPIKKITASLGVAVTSNKTILTENFISYADQALYRAKQAGRNTFDLVYID